MQCNKVLFQVLLDCFDNDLKNNFENNAWNLEHNAEKLQEILNRIMQGIMGIITSPLVLGKPVTYYANKYTIGVKDLGILVTRFSKIRSN